jgi:hypothetical protein
MCDLRLTIEALGEGDIVAVRKDDRLTDAVSVPRDPILDRRLERVRCPQTPRLDDQEVRFNVARSAGRPGYGPG